MTYLITPLAVILYSAIIYLLVGRHRHERPGFLFACIGMGILSAMVALTLEYGWHLATRSWMSSHTGFVFLDSFIGVSLIEEAAKWVWFPLLLLRRPSFLHYIDGIIYACAIAAGFNLVEGSIYALNENDPGNMLIRSFTAVPVHFLFAIVMGFLMSRYRIESQPSIWYALVIPVILHGLYDFFIFQTYSETLMGGALVVLAGSLLLSIWLCRMALRAGGLPKVPGLHPGLKEGKPSGLM